MIYLFEYYAYEREPNTKHTFQIRGKLCVKFQVLKLSDKCCVYIVYIHIYIYIKVSQALQVCNCAIVVLENCFQFFLIKKYYAETNT